MSQVNAQRKTLEVLAEEFAARYRRGERPPLSEYIDAHPELAAEIRELFPTLVVMEELAPSDSGKPVRTTAAPGEPQPSLNDYRILREIGRGGMGIVYEAEQLSLGRRVALKVLRQAAGDDTIRQRFHREARAAARLHHTNIVPVFEVGEDHGRSWYAMQLILGQGLDQIIEELRQQRGHRSQGHSQFSQVTQAFVSGQFARPDLDPAASGSSVSREAQRSALPLADALRCASRLTEDAGASSAGHSELSVGDSTRGPYYRSVARIGRQAAEALAHAHARGIIHRDVKPSNLLLDMAGVIWITDFGLAKTQENSLTVTGDVVGTLRYMSPERFNGEGDARADVYGLGLTLYELLVVRPAFAERDRLQLIDLIKNQEPVRPRTVDHRIPRDLETIILTASHKDAKRRYQTAEAMAEDLRRFLANEPIRAKRSSHLTRLRLWSHRHPALAALLVVLMLVAVASTATAFYLRETLRDEESSRKRAEKAELEGEHKLWLSYVSQARAMRMSRQPGQCFASLRAIKEALALPAPPGHSRDELRTEAIAALCLPDIMKDRDVGREINGAKALTIDAAFQRYAWADKEGNVSIHSLSDGVELMQLPGGGFVSATVALQFSPDGRFLHQSCQSPGRFRARLWNLDAPQPRTVLDDEHGSLAFRPDSRQAAAAYPDGTIRFFDTKSGRELRRFSTGTPPDAGLHWNPRLPQLLLHANPSLRLLDVDTGEVGSVGPNLPDGYSVMDWHPEGRLLALSNNSKIYLWDVRAGRQAMPPLEGHKSAGIYLRFNRAGDRLLSTDWTSSEYLWDTRTGRPLLYLPGLGSVFHFSPDDSLVARLVSTGVGVKVQISRFRRGEEFYTLAHRMVPRVYSQGHSCFDAEGRLCAIWSHEEGITLVDLMRAEDAAALPLPANLPLRFDSEGALWTCGPAGLLRWPAADLKVGQRRYGPPQRILRTAPNACHDSSADLQVVALSDFSRGVVFHRIGHRFVNLGPQEDVRNSAVSPDGRWVVTGSHELREGAGAKVWDAKDGRHIKDLPVGGYCRVRFSPDGKWLLTTSGGCRLWAVGSWEEGPRLSGSPTNPGGAFSSDGKLMALGDAPGVVRLLVTDSGRELARLTAPEQTRLVPCCFTPDGAKLLVVGVETRALHLFDLRAIRAGLTALGLNWDAPSHPPAAAAENPPPLDVAVDMGMLVPQEPPRQAVVKYSLALAVLPLNPVAHLRRGHAYYRMGHWQQAANDLGVALALDPDNKDALAWSELASACLRCAQPQQAAAAYDRVILLGDADASVYNQRGIVYYLLGQWEKAISDISKALELQADFPMAKNNLAWLLTACPESKFRDPVRAVELAKQAAASQPKEGTFLTTLGMAHYRAGDWTAARNALEKSLEQGQGRSNAFWFGRTTLFLAMSHWQLGDKEKAPEHYQKAIEWMKKNQPALEKDQGRWNELRRFQTEADALLVPW